MVPAAVAKRASTMAASRALHDRHEALVGRRFHFAREAALAARPLIGDQAVSDACRLHRDASRVKHGPRLRVPDSWEDLADTPSLPCLSPRSPSSPTALSTGLVDAEEPSGLLPLVLPPSEVLLPPEDLAASSDPPQSLPLAAGSYSMQQIDDLFRLVMSTLTTQQNSAIQSAASLITSQLGESFSSTSQMFQQRVVDVESSLLTVIERLGKASCEMIQRSDASHAALLETRLLEAHERVRVMEDQLRSQQLQGVQQLHHSLSLRLSCIDTQLAALQDALACRGPACDRAADWLTADEDGDPFGGVVCLVTTTGL